MGRRPLTIEALSSLAADGNRELAWTIYGEQGEGTFDPQTAEDALHRACPKTNGIFAPIVDVARPERSFSARIELAEGPGRSPVLGQRALDATNRAIAEAWEIAGGTGPVPDLHARVQTAERLGVEIEGSSLYLATALAALARFGEVPAIERNVLATGAPGENLRYLAAKRDVSACVRTTLRQGKLLALGQPAPDPDDEVEPVHDLRSAATRVFGYVPWAPSAPCDRVHLYCHESRGGAPFEGGVLKKLPDDLAPEHLGPGSEVDGIIGEVFQHRGRYVVSIAGPVVLAAYLGWRLNSYRELRVLQQGRPYWDQAQREPVRAAVPAAGSRPPMRLALVRPGSKAPPPGWERHDLPVEIRPENAPFELRRLLERCNGAEELDLSIDAALAFAFAVGSVLANRVSVVYWGYRGPELRPWFRAPAGVGAAGPLARDAG